MHFVINWIRLVHGNFSAEQCNLCYVLIHVTVLETEVEELTQVDGYKLGYN